MLTTLLLILSIGTLLIWVLGLVWYIRFYSQPPKLSPTAAQLDAAKSFVSVIVPARNEAGRSLRTSIDSMIGQGYLNMEVVAVNDRSRDGTLEILKEMEGFYPTRLRVVDGAELPAGWLGKPHALQQGFEQSSGRWVLATDADIHFSPIAVEAAVKYAEDSGLDALTLIPRIIVGSFWEKVFMPVFGWFCLLAMPLHRVNDPKRSESLGIGNFFLIRREVLKSLGGFTCIKNEVAEDLRLAAIIKGNGFSLRVETAPELLETRMYEGLREIWQGFTKNLFSGIGFSTVKGLLSVLSIIGIGFGPIFLSVFLTISELYLFAFLFFLAYICQVILFWTIIKSVNEEPLYSILTPLGFGLYAMILTNSMYKILSGRGVEWKGRNIYGPEGRPKNR